ncbi:MAG: hypothetical protein J6J11_00285 [Treponema sp.]|nr:hypothetical protein [Treponema sp.]
MSIYKKQSEEQKTFETAQDFLKYYEKNKDDLDEINTRSMNLKFKINGHHIGRKQGKLILYPIKKFEENAPENEEMKDQIRELQEGLDDLREMFNKMVDQIKKLQGRINQSTSLPYNYHK